MTGPLFTFSVCALLSLAPSDSGGRNIDYHCRNDDNHLTAHLSLAVSPSTPAIIPARLWEMAVIVTPGVLTREVYLICSISIARSFASSTGNYTPKSLIAVPVIFPFQIFGGDWFSSAKLPTIFFASLLSLADHLKLSIYCDMLFLNDIFSIGNTIVSIADDHTPHRTVYSHVAPVSFLCIGTSFFTWVIRASKF